MTTKNFAQLYEDLTEGYTVNLISKDGFEACVSFSHMDDEGEYYFSAVGINGSGFARNSEIMNSNELEKFVMNNGFHAC